MCLWSGRFFSPRQMLRPELIESAMYKAFTECSILVTSSLITEILRDSVFLVPRNYVAQPLAFLAGPPKCPDTGDEDFCREGELDFVCEM